jgi:putative ABC transport system ATP-binding protein
VGRILIDGEDIGAMDEDARAALRGRCIGFVFQSFQLLSSLNALENVMLPLELAGHPDAGKEAALWLGRVGLSHRQKHYPRHLSGGEQQRVALARAFAPRPKIVFGDEPTGNLDESTGRQIIDLMFAINAESRTTLVLATHDARIAARCARRLEMRSGKAEEVCPGIPLA